MDLAARILFVHERCHVGTMQLVWQLNAGVEWRPTIIELVQDLQELGNLVEELADQESARTSGSNSHVNAVADVCHTGNLPD